MRVIGMIKTVSIEMMQQWSKSNIGGLIVCFSPENAKAVSYFLNEFALQPQDPMDKIGALRLNNLIVLGRLWFLVDVKSSL